MSLTFQKHSEHKKLLNTKKFFPKGKNRKDKGNALENDSSRMKIRPERAK
jgi:hypothetical protein